MAGKKQNTIIELKNMPIETLAEMANESAAICESSGRVTVQKAIEAGRCLAAIKVQKKHGEWLPWLESNWNFGSQLAARYMQIANYAHERNLEEAASIRGAMRLISDTKEKTPQGAAKKPGSKASTASSESEKTQDEEKPDEEKSDPVDDWFSNRTLEDVAFRWIGKDPDAKAKKSAAKHLRRVADKLDPPAKFVRPTLDEVIEYCEQRHNAVDPEKFHSYYAANGWRLSNGNRMADWQAAVITWESRANGNGALKKDGARIRRRKAKEVVYDD